MKKISYYLVFIVVAGLILTGFWAYQRYFKQGESPSLVFEVERGDIQESVRVRGAVASQKEFDLAFPFAGTVEGIFVEEGESVSSGQVLLRLETRDLVIDQKRLEALLSQHKASLEKLIAGATTEELKVLETAVLNAQTDLDNAEQNLADVKAETAEDLEADYQSGLNTLDDIYLKAYNAQNAVDSVQRANFTGNDQEGIKVRENKAEIEAAVSDIKSSLDQAKETQSYEDIDQALSSSKVSLGDIAESLKVIRQICEEPTYRDLVSAANKTSLDTQRSNINNVLADLSNGQQAIASTKVANEASINSAQGDVDSAKGDLEKAQDELELKRAGARPEDLAIAEAKVKESESQVEAVKEKIRKSSLYAPGPARIVKLWLEKGEIFQSSQTAVSLSLAGYKIQADISELEIRKIREVDGNEVSIKLDAFPGQEFQGKVVSVEPREVIKEEDKYYRVNIYLEDKGEEIRSGMSADLLIKVSFKENVLKIPEFAVYEQEGKEFVKILEGNQTLEVEVKTGISNGESIEVQEGLEQGQTVVVSVD